MNNESKFNPSKMTLDNFSLITVIGKGAYDKVILVKNIKNGKYFALKIIKKKNIEQKRQYDHIFNEKNILV